MNKQEAIEFGESRLGLFGGKMEEFIKLSVEVLKKQDKEHLHQKQKAGHWRPSIMGISECSECGYDNGLAKWNFCPICGARMIEPQTESEET